MKQALILCIILVLSYSRSPAQTLLPLDYRDLIGQRLGWSAEKIHSTVIEQADFAYTGHFTLDDTPGTLLVFTGSHQEELKYRLVNGVAVDATLSIPAGPYALDMVKSIQQSCKMIAYIPDQKIAQYRSPYCLILIYRTEQDGIDKVFFAYNVTKP